MTTSGLVGVGLPSDLVLELGDASFGRTTCCQRRSRSVVAHPYRSLSHMRLSINALTSSGIHASPGWSRASVAAVNVVSRSAVVRPVCGPVGCVTIQSPDR